MTTLVDAISVATADVPRVIVLGGSPAKGADGKVIYPYGVFSGALGGGTSYTLDSEHGLRSGIVTIQTFGRTVTAASDHMEKILGALLDRSLTITGYQPSSPLRAALDQPAVQRDPDDGGVIGMTMPLLFTVAKEA